MTRLLLLFCVVLIALSSQIVLADEWPRDIAVIVRVGDEAVKGFNSLRPVWVRDGGTANERIEYLCIDFDTQGNMVGQGHPCSSSAGEKGK